MNKMPQAPNIHYGVHKGSPIQEHKRKVLSSEYHHNFLTISSDDAQKIRDITKKIKLPDKHLAVNTQFQNAIDFGVVDIGTKDNMNNPCCRLEIQRPASEKAVYFVAATHFYCNFSKLPLSFIKYVQKLVKTLNDNLGVTKNDLKLAKRF